MNRKICVKQSKESNRNPSGSNKKRRLSLHKIVRRIHMYLGLILIPWLILYGTTAILFNHGDWFTDRNSYTVERIKQPFFIEAESIAKDTLLKMKNENIKLIPNSAKWIGSIRLQGKKEDQTVRIYIQPDGYGGVIRVYPNDKEQPQWSQDLEKLEPISKDVKKNIENIILDNPSLHELELTDISLQRSPTLRFQIDNKGEIQTLELNSSGNIEVKSGDGSSTLRKKLLRLHVQHGEPGYVGARWIWARIVDIMGISMIMWGLTGLYMWWHIRPTRKSGAIAIISGFGLIGFLSFSIWSVLGL